MLKYIRMLDLRNKFWKLFNPTWPIFIILILCLSLFWKSVFKGEVPIPADIPLGIYYPWLDYKWGFTAGVPIKNPIMSDVVSFTFPMQTLAVALVKSGQLPLWNQYILGGTPLLANFQSSPFSPTNFLYFLFDKLSAWSIQIVLQHFLAGTFTYLLLRHWKISKVGSLLGGIIFAFSGFNIIWSQWNGHALSASFFPLILLLADKWLLVGRFRYGLVLSISFALFLLSGYPQIGLYLILGVFVLWLLRVITSENKLFRTLYLGIFLTLGVGLAAFQILPGYELLSQSQRISELHPYEWAFLPWAKIITFIAPDFFGNHATGNYWGPQDYTSNTGFVGVVGFTLALLSITLIRKKKEVLYCSIIVIVSLLLAFPTPLSIFLWKSGLLGLNAASAHRSLILFNLGIALLAGFGFDGLRMQSKFKYKFNIAALLIIFFLILGFGVYAFSSDQAVGLRNLVLPFFVFAVVTFTVLLVRKGRLVLVLITVTELFYFGWKFTPFTSRELVFPSTPVIKFLQKQPKPFRVVADKVIPINLLMNYGIETLEGYDAVYPESSAEFISKINGSFGSENSIRRYGIIDNYDSKLLDLANVKYLIIKKDDLKNFLRNKKFRVAFEDKSVVVLENINIYPRAFVYYGKEANRPQYLNAEFAKYSDQESLIKINAKEDGSLFISDTWYPGWKAYVDGVETNIYRVDFLFRSIPIPSGNHEIRMVYVPVSFYDGLEISVASMVLLIILVILGKRLTPVYTSNINVKR